MFKFLVVGSIIISSVSLFVLKNYKFQHIIIRDTLVLLIVLFDVIILDVVIRYFRSNYKKNKILKENIKLSKEFDKINDFKTNKEKIMYLYDISRSRYGYISYDFIGSIIYGIDPSFNQLAYIKQVLRDNDLFE